MPRTQEQNKEIREKTKNAIIASALKLFAEKGFHGTSINDIAKDAGISKGLAYNYFRSKQHLLEAVFSQINEIGNELENAVKNIDDPYEKLEVLINTSLSFAKDNEEYWRLYLSLALQPSVFDTAMLASKQFANQFLKYTVKIFKDIGAKNPDLEARVFGAVFDGLSLQYLMDKENFPLERMHRFLLRKYGKNELGR